MIGKPLNRIRTWLRGDRRRGDAAVLLGVLLLGGVVRAVYLWQFSQHHLCHVAVGPDVQEYDLWAREILGGSLAWRKLHIHAPLYAYFLAVLYRLTGQSLVVVRTCQLFLDLGALTMACGACRLLWGRRAATATGVLWALYAPLVYYSAELFCEVLVVFMVTAALLVWAWLSQVEAATRRSSLAFLLFGFCLGLASVSHPLMLLSAGAMSVCAVIGLWRKEGRRMASTAGVLVLAGVALPVVPVSLQNWAVSGEFVLIQAREGMNLYIGNNPDANGTCYLRPGVEYDALVAWPEREGVTGEAASRRFYREKALAFVREHPVRWLGLLGRKLLLTWNATELPSGPDLPAIRSMTAFMRWPWLRFGVICPLALVGVSGGRRSWGTSPVWCLLGAHTLALALFVTSGRYRLGMVPAVLMAAGVGVSVIIRAWEQDDRRQCRRIVVGVIGGCALAFAPRPPPLLSGPAEVASLLAQAAWRHGDIADAEKHVVRALSIELENAGLYHLHGVLLAERGRFGEALVCYETALAFRPGVTSVRIDRAGALSELDRKDMAEQELRSVLEGNPTSAKAWYNLGVIQESIGQPAEALVSYDQAILLSPALSSAHLNRGVVLHRQGRAQEALSSYRSALRVRPDNARAWSCAALAHIDLGERGKACAAFEESLRLEPFWGDIWLAYARYVAEAGDERRVAALLTAGRQANPEHQELLKATPTQLWPTSSARNAEDRSPQ